MKNQKILAYFLVLIVFIISSCNYNWSNNQNEMESGSLDNNNQAEVGNNNIEQNETQKVLDFYIESKVEEIDWNFVPSFSLSQINVKKWDKIRITIENTKWTHDFKLDEFSVFAETPEWEKTVVEFVADKVWSFTYYCSKPWHRAAWQFWTLVVYE